MNTKTNTTKVKKRYIIGILIVMFASLFVFNKLGGKQTTDLNTNKTAKNTTEVVLKPFSEISEEEYKLNLATSKDLVVIDIRTPEEIALGKITEETLEINFYKEDFKVEIEKLDRNKTYFIYCEHANRTKEAKTIMQDLGFKNAFDLKGGIVAWESELYVQPTREEVIGKYLGKPSVLIFTSTDCPHCQQAMPVFESGIWDAYHDRVNIFVNVLDDGKFPQERVAQGFDPLLNFKIVTNEDCKYVPSWVILNSSGEVQEKSCGTEKGMEDIVTKLNILLK